ncbi:hypothetical protein V8E55_006932 [Tylopilus felleus]
MLSRQLRVAAIDHLLDEEHSERNVLYRPVYEEVFANIAHDIAIFSNLPDDEQILRKIGHIAIQSLEIYESESEREGVVYLLGAALLGVNLHWHIPTSSTQTARKNDAIYMHLESKNKLVYYNPQPHVERWVIEKIVDPRGIRLPSVLDWIFAEVG